MVGFWAVPLTTILALLRNADSWLATGSSHSSEAWPERSVWQWACLPASCSP